MSDMTKDDPNLTDPVCIDKDSAERLHEQLDALHSIISGTPTAEEIECARETLDYVARMLRVGAETYDGDTSGKALVDDAHSWRRLKEMGGMLHWNNRGGYWSASCSSVGSHAVEFDEDPAVAVAKVHAMWTAAGRPTPRVMTQEERERCDVELDEGRLRQAADVLKRRRELRDA